LQFFSRTISCFFSVLSFKNIAHILAILSFFILCVWRKT